MDTNQDTTQTITADAYASSGHAAMKFAEKKHPGYRAVTATPRSASIAASGAKVMYDITLTREATR